MGINIQNKLTSLTCKSSLKPLLERPSPLMSSQQTPLRTSKPRSRIRKEFPQISKDSSSPESNLKMEELSPTTTSKRSQPSILSLDLEVVCKSSSRLSPVRPSPLMSNQQTPSRTSRPRSKTRKESHQISKDLSSLESNLRMAELFLTTTSKRSPHFISSSDLEVVCKSSSRLSPVRPSPLMSSQQILLRTSRPRSKTRKVFLQISKDLSSLESNLRMAEPSPTTTFKKNLPSTWSSDLEVVCKSSSRLSLVRPSLSMSSQQTLSKMSRLRSKIRKASHQISKDLSSLESNSKTAEPFPITTSKRSPPFTSSLDSEEVNELLLLVNQL